MEGFKDIVDKYLNKLLSLDNVVGMGHGYREINGKQTDERCIVVLVENKIAKEELDSNHIVPQSLEEHKTDIIEIGKVELLKSDGSSRIVKSRPAQPGMSIGHYKITAGTFGAVVRDNQTGELLILSNNHVLANVTNGSDGRAKIGDHILQPGSYDGGNDNQDVIGYLERFIPIYNDQRPNCPLMNGFTKLANGVGKLVNSNKGNSTLVFKNKVDCAVARVKSSDLINPEILSIGKVKGKREADLGMLVRKSGRTSGLTSAHIKALDAVVKVQLSASEAAVFTDQIVTEPFSQPGDSGSLVVDENNQAVGLLFAGSDKSTICNKVDNVLEALDVSL